MAHKVIIDRHLCLTAQGCCVVEETDTRARWLKWAPGNEVDRDEYERLTNCGCGRSSSEAGEPQLPEVVLDFVEPPKKRAPAGNKSRTPQANK